MKKSGWALSSTTTCNVSSDSIRPTNCCSSVMVSGSAKFIGGLLNVTRQYPVDTSVIVNWVNKAVIRRIPPFQGAAHRNPQVPSTFGRDNEDDIHHPHCQERVVMLCSARSAVVNQVAGAGRRLATHTRHCDEPPWGPIELTISAGRSVRPPD